MFNCIAIIGMGLIGSSVARAVREKMPQVKIIAVESDEAARAFTLKHKLAQVALAEPGAALAEAQLVIYALPIDMLGRTARNAAGFLSKGALVTDVASVKEPVIYAINDSLPEGVTYIPGHPIAGSEKRGVEAGTAELFAGKRVVLTPDDPQAHGVSEVAAFWSGLGAVIEYMPAELHDRIYAAVSHLPQYLAYAVGRLYAGQESTLPYSETLARFLRLTASDRGLWETIFVVNKDNIQNLLQWFLEVIHQLRSELAEWHGQPQHAPEPGVMYGTLLPYLISSALVSTVFRLERELGVQVGRFAGTGFQDFTAPLESPPERVLEMVSQHAQEVGAALDHFVSLLTGDSLQ